MNTPVGFSTGAMWRYNLSLSECAHLFLEVGADAIEIMTRPEEGRITDPAVGKLASRFKYASMHLPQLQTFANISEWASFAPDGAEEVYKAFTTHPDEVALHDLLEMQRILPLVAFENMDKRKSEMKSPDEFRVLRDQGVNSGFVLDLQHVHEVGVGPQTARSFMDVFGGELRHLHVSGETEEYYHMAVAHSDNRAEILALLSECRGVPVILEGTMPVVTESKLIELLKEELELIRTALGSD